MLPPGISFFHVEESLRQWRTIHGSLFPWACLQALYSPTDSSFIYTHFLLMKVLPRWGDGDGDGDRWKRRAFRVDCLSVVPFVGSEILGSNWVHGSQSRLIEQDMYEFNSKYSQLCTFKVLLIIWCPPFDYILVTYTLTQDFVMRDYHRPDWKEAVVADVEEGSSNSPLVTPPPPPPSRQKLLRMARIKS